MALVNTEQCIVTECLSCLWLVYLLREMHVTVKLFRLYFAAVWDEVNVNLILLSLCFVLCWLQLQKKITMTKFSWKKVIWNLKTMTLIFVLNKSTVNSKIKGEPKTDVHCESKNRETIFLSITPPDADRFSKLLYPFYNKYATKQP